MDKTNERDTNDYFREIVKAASSMTDSEIEKMYYFSMGVMVAGAERTKRRRKAKKSERA